MKVHEIMTKDVKSCTLGTNLATAVELMWSADCGVLPVLEDGALVGIITDRDICIALGTRTRLATDINVGEVATRAVQTCAPNADINSAMAVMRRAKVRRLPVVDNNQLQGLIALNDIIEAVNRKHGDIDYEDVMNTLKAVSEHRTHKKTATHTEVAPHAAVAVA